MRIFDPHIHMTSRTTNDYVQMYDAGVRAVVEPSFWLGQPRTNVGSFADYFDALIGWERFRAAQYGIRHHCTVGLNPKEANDPRCREVLGLLPRYLAKDGVVAVGETGYDSMTADEDEVFAAQLEPVHAWVRRRLGPQLRARVDTQDLAQSSLAEAFRDLQGFEWRGRESFQRWLRTTVETP